MADTGLPPDDPIRYRLPKPLDGLERRAFARAPINQMCDLDIPSLPFMLKAMIVDLSAGGMRLRIPRIDSEHLTNPFYVVWPMGGTMMRTPVFRLYHYSNNEIAARFISTGGTLSSEISRYVYIVLKSKLQSGKLYDLPAPTESLAPVARRERRARLMKNQQMGLQDATMAAKNLHQSNASRWINRRVVSHLETD